MPLLPSISAATCAPTASLEVTACYQADRRRAVPVGYCRVVSRAVERPTLAKQPQPCPGKELLGKGQISEKDRRTTR